jgi:hypothetical protein
METETMGSYARLFFQLVLPVLTLLGVCQFLGIYWDIDAPLSVAVAGSGLFSFVFFVNWSKHLPGAGHSLETMLRGAIAAAIVVEYLVLIGIVAFFRGGADKLPPITESLVSSFTAIVGVVIAFYFGSSAFIQVFKQNDENPSTRQEKTHEEQH